ncbi:MAG: DNA-binding protein [Halofilum sp. (in: g-proteobacteria)]
MGNLVVRGLDDRIVQALKRRAAEHQRSAEAEHRAILEQALTSPPRRPLAEVLAEMPDAGEDADFQRRDESAADDVFG